MSTATHSGNAMQYLSTGTIIAVSVTGSVIVIAFCALLFLLVRLISDHRRLVRDLESHGIVVRGNTSQIHDKLGSRSRLIRPLDVASSSKIDHNPQASTKSIESRFVNDRSLLQPTDIWPISRGSLTFARNALAKRPMMLKDMKPVTLPEVNERSDMARLSSSPSPPPPMDEDEGQFRTPPINQAQVISTNAGLSRAHRNSLSQENLFPRPLFSQAPKSSEPGPASLRKHRARTIGTTDGVSHQQDQLKQLSFHGRSISLGSQNPGTCPHEPVPPLPLSADKKHNKSGLPRPSACATTSLRRSISSVDSIGSSLLLGSPKATRPSSARFRNGAFRAWKSSVIIGPRPLRKAKSLYHHGISWSDHKSFRSVRSIHSHEGRYSSGSSSSLLALKKGPDRMMPTMGTSPDPILRASQGSSIVNSSKAFLESVINANEPANLKDSQPYHHKTESDAFILRHGSSPRETSPNSTGISSTRSSNGNPFQWDLSPVQISKPFALKGSPNARKGHRRQNCVRISLPSAVINRTRSSVLSTDEIIEDPRPIETQTAAEAATPVATQGPRNLPRPPSTSTFAPEITTPLTSLSLLDPGSPSASPSTQSMLSDPVSVNHSPSGSCMFNIPYLHSSSRQLSNLNPASMPFSFDGPASDKPDVTSLPVEFKLLARPMDLRKHRPKVASVAPSDHDHAHQESAALDKNENDQQDPNHATTIRSSPQPNFYTTSNDQALLSDDSAPCSPKSQPLRNFQGLGSGSRNSNIKSYFQAIPNASGECRDDGIGEDKPSPVRFSIAALRRMNSDANEDAKAARRYFRIADRHGSPTPQHVNRSRCDSWTSLQSESKSIGMSKVGDDSMIEFENEIDLMLAESNNSWVSHNRSLSEMDKLIEASDDLVIPDGGFGLCTIVETDTTDLRVAKRKDKCATNSQSFSSSVDVWDDGEDGHGNSQRPSMQPAFRPVPFKAVNGKPRQTKTSIELKLIPPSNQATPKSLYDENGFYRDNDR